MNVNELLPIGSIVLLEGAEKKLMIFGVGQTQLEENKDFDYIGLSYYPFWHGTMDDLRNNMQDLALRYRRNCF